MTVRDAVTLSLLPRADRLRQPEAAGGGTSELARTFEALAACERDGTPSDSVFERLLDVLDPDHEPASSLRALRLRAHSAIERGRRATLAAWPFGSEAYPRLLAQIYDPPPVVWVRGCSPAAVVEQPAVAIVGSRAASAYAIEVAAHLGSDLARRGVIVVSGMARGVDSAAHRGALEGGGGTIAVLGCGADVVYPHEHGALAEQIAAGGALISELPPGTGPRAYHFPRRNRIISGLSSAVVIVEANERSGSLITASCALEQGRDVMAVPGNVLSGRNRGSHSLLKDGAKIVESADDILEELGLGGAGTGAGGGEAAQDDALLRMMAPGEAYDLDALVSETGLDGKALLARLAELELSGGVRRVEGGRFVRRRGGVL